MKRLERAVAAEDWATICDELFTPAARRRAGGAGLPAPAALGRRGRHAGHGSSVVSDRAEARASLVRVRSRARGQPPLADVIELRREADGYRIESLRG